MTQATESPAVDVASAYRSLADRLEQIVRFDVRASDVVVEDACQFAWSRLMLHADRVRPESTLTWLTRTAIREAIKLIRRDDRELSLEASALSAPTDLRPLPEEHAEQLERLALVGRLPERQQRMLWLHALGLSYEEISVQLGCSRRTVERQLLRAKRSVRRAAAE
jgi:RNA polymerase sigma factor (sigma-70 family)